MTNLTYSTFMNLLIESYDDSISSEELARGLLDEITPDKMHDKYSSAYLSYIFTGQRNIPTELRDAISKREYRKKCYEYFKSDIIPELSPELINDYLHKLTVLISNDETISEDEKKSLIEKVTIGEYREHLSDVFIYCIKKPNKANIDGSLIGPDDIPLLSEVDQQCPICRGRLYETKGLKTFYRYSITKIFPEGLSDDKESEFDSIHPKPADMNSVRNKICLCDNCAADYLFSPTAKLYDRLCIIKRDALNKDAIKARTSDVPLEDKIVVVFSKLKEVDPNSERIIELRMKPLKIKNKIQKENDMLKSTITDNVTKWYYIVEDMLSTLDDQKSNFNIIASEIKLCYQRLAALNLNQYSVYQELIDWMQHTLSLPNDYQIAINVVVSFFVQNCEVFDEIPEQSNAI